MPDNADYYFCFGSNFRNQFFTDGGPGLLQKKGQKV